MQENKGFGNNLSMASLRTTSLFLLVIISLLQFQARAQTADAKPERNSRLSNDITYYLEVRDTNAKDSIPLLDKKTRKPVVLLGPGDLVQFRGDEKTLGQHLKDEQAGRVHELETTDGYLLEANWQKFYTLNAVEIPVFLTLADESEGKVITIFKDAGHVSWTECVATPDLCIAWPHKKSIIQLLDSKVLSDSDGKKNLFYNVSFRYLPMARDPKEGVHSEIIGEGWVPGQFLKRKAGTVTIPEPKVIISTNDDNKKPEATPIISDERLQDLMARSQKFSRWTKLMPSMIDPNYANDPNRDVASLENQTRAKGAPSSLFNLKVDYDIYADYVNRDITVSGGNAFDIHQQGMKAGWFGVAPIFFDLELGGSVEYFYPIVSTPEDEDVRTFYFQQHLAYMTTLGSSATSLKFGAGWRLQKLINMPDSFTIGTAAGIHALTMVENPKYFANLKLGFVSTSTGPKPTNYDVQIDGGWRLNPQKGFQSWAVTLGIHIMDLTDKDDNTLHTNDYLLGFRRTL